MRNDKWETVPGCRNSVVRGQSSGGLGFRNGLFIVRGDFRPLPPQLGPQQGAEILLPEMNQGKRFRRLPDYQAFSHFDGIGGTAV